MNHVVSSLTIQNLQAAAALLMGYDYFLSPYLKGKADAAARAYLQAQHDLSAQQLSMSTLAANEVKAMTLAIMVLVAGFAFAMLALRALYRIHSNAWWLAGTAIVALFFATGALQGVAKLIGTFVGPRVAPTLFLPLAKFLLLSSRGVIAALGFLLLIGSFTCRYVNELS